MLPADTPPILVPKSTTEPSVFQAANLLREGRRQLGRTDRPVPHVCLLDPDGDVVRHLRATAAATLHDGWACYHSELWTTRVDELEIGVVGCAVGAPYATLVAEQLVASGCGLIVSVTSAGRINPLGDPPYFVVLERARRDEGTSIHYLPPSEWSTMHPRLLDALRAQPLSVGERVHFGSSWTTDAPFRETQEAIDDAAGADVHAVEMEAAALYAFAAHATFDLVCVAHVTNTMAVDGDDFEKGADNGTQRILGLAVRIAELVGHTQGPVISMPETDPN
jgi:uridine phosphorylase